MAFGDKNNMYEITGHVSKSDFSAIINRVILVVVRVVAKAFSKGQNSSLAISTLACSGEFSFNKTQ